MRIASKVDPQLFPLRDNAYLLYTTFFCCMPKEREHAASCEKTEQENPAQETRRSGHRREYPADDQIIFLHYLLCLCNSHLHDFLEGSEQNVGVERPLVRFVHHDARVAVQILLPTLRRQEYKKKGVGGRGNQDEKYQVLGSNCFKNFFFHENLEHADVVKRCQTCTELLIVQKIRPTRSLHCIMTDLSTAFQKKKNSRTNHFLLPFSASSCTRVAKQQFNIITAGLCNRSRRESKERRENMADSLPQRLSQENAVGHVLDDRLFGGDVLEPNGITHLSGDF